MKKKVKTLLIVAGALLLFIVLKPSEENFNRYVKENYDKIESSDSWKSIAKKTAVNLGKSTLNAQSQLTVDYQDKVFFAFASRYRMDQKEKYLGVLGFWVKIK